MLNLHVPLCRRFCHRVVYSDLGIYGPVTFESVDKRTLAVPPRADPPRTRASLPPSSRTTSKSLRSNHGRPRRFQGAADSPARLDYCVRLSRGTFTMPRNVRRHFGIAFLERKIKESVRLGPNDRPSGGSCRRRARLCWELSDVPSRAATSLSGSGPSAFSRILRFAGLLP